MNLETEMLKVMRGAVKRSSKTSSYDTPAVVTRVDDATIWVHIDGGVDETPVRKTIDAKPGDSVQIRVAGGKAWVTGNSTRPPTDDSTANYAVNIANETNRNVVEIRNFVVDEIDAQRASIGELEADTAKVHNLTAEQLSATVGYINDLNTGNVTASDIIADHGAIETLDVQTMAAAAAYIDDLTAGNVTANDIIADHAAIDDLDATYASIDLANVNNAWITNGVIKNGAIADAQIIGISANKLTAGTIDASNITVTNLNADNITTGTINGQRIGSESITLDKLAEEVPTKEYLDGVAENLQGQIDGQIETWTGSVVPTLNNSPASSWTTNADKKKHVGDIYYVVNAANDADGYTYRFTESGTSPNFTYSWTLIKDNQITKALQDILDIQGDISDIETFDSQISSWKTDTTEELSSLKTRTSSLETSMGSKVDTSTFNELSQTVDTNSASITSLSTTVAGKADSSTVTTLSNTVNTVSQTADANSSKISNLTTVLGTNADGTTKTGDIVHRTSAVEQDLSGFKTTVSQTYQTKSDMGDYSTTAQMNTAISQSANSITTSVAATYATNDRVSTAESNIQQNADNIALKVSQNGVIASINASPESITISADKVNIAGAAIFTSGRLSETSLNNAYDAKGAASTAESNAIAAIPTNVSDFTNDSGYQTSTQVETAITGKGYQTSSQVESAITSKGYQTATDVSTAVTNGVSGKADKTAAVSEEQYIYISKASGTASVSGTTTWITETGDKQNTWTTKRPTYNTSYPVLFVAKQKKTVSGTVTCTTPLKDDTTTVIDGGHITTGTIDAARLNVGDIISSGSIAVTSDLPTKVSDLTNDSGFQNSTQVDTAITSKGYQTSTQVESAITSKGYQTASQVSTAITNGITGKADKTDALSRSQRIYYRKTSSGAPSKNTTWLSTSGTGYGNWSLKIPQLTSGSTKYPYLYTAVQTQTVSQQAAGTTCSCSDVLLDDTTTIIDGGNIITGTVSANAVNASSGTFDAANIPNLSANKITTGTLDASKVTVSNLSVGMSAVTGLSDALSWTIEVRATALNYEANTATLTATVYKSGTVQTSGFTRQWYKNGTAVSGQTGDTLSVTDLSAAYTCRVTY